MLTSLTLTNFKSFRRASIPLGPFSLLVGANASGKSNLRDAFRFLHGIGRGYGIAEILGEKWGEGGELQWRGIRGGTREIAYAGETEFGLEIDLRTLRPAPFEGPGVSPPLQDRGRSRQYGPRPARHARVPLLRQSHVL